ncbi:MAG: thiamine-phosphate kinase [Pseudomonadota bacterium]|nr:thiamine-phosphate kinase [Pseudomonadota bacterium]
MGEFELIARFFNPADAPAPDERVALGIGDDCALLHPAPGQQLAVSSDMLVEGRHFFADAAPENLGHKALAVNLSDLAACGAEPLAFTLALALPTERARDHAWLGAFSHGLLALARQHRCPLVGGDTTAGPLNICITVFGQVPPGQALRRSGAQAGDDIWVSGTLGDARLALGALRSEWALPPAALHTASQRLHRPSPRVALGLALRGIATAAADISDGLAGDLGHILHASGTGAWLDAQIASDLIAINPFLLRANGQYDSSGALLHLPTPAQRLHSALSGGDDYELVFTAPAAARTAVQAAGQQTATAVTRIGAITAGSGLHLRQPDGRTTPLAARAFDHFGHSAPPPP